MPYPLPKRILKAIELLRDEPLSDHPQHLLRSNAVDDLKFQPNQPKYPGDPASDSGYFRRVSTDSEANVQIIGEISGAQVGPYADIETVPATYVSLIFMTYSEVQLS
jgi:hypothetical protein